MITETRAERPRAFDPSYAAQAPIPRRTPGWDLATERRLDDGRTLARGLGWFSIGLGLVELLAPERITDFLGVDDRHTGLVRMYGLREIGSGVAILSERTPAAGVWSRVAGDALDFATLGAALADDDARIDRVLAAMAFVAGAAMLDAKCARQLARTSDPRQRKEYS
jgi:hypothetical protein